MAAFGGQSRSEAKGGFRAVKQMRIDFPYPGMPGLEVPDENLVGVYQPRQTSLAQPEEEVIRQGLATPIGTGRVSELAREGQRVLILCDDNTRPTPASLLMPHILDELHRGGVRKRDVRILMAVGTHRPMTYDEMCEKLGQRICEEYQLTNHDWRNESSLAYMGTTSSGVEILVNRLVLEADVVLGVGHIVPHGACGFTGGGKIVLPGICGQKSTLQMHTLSDVGFRGKAENPVRQAIDEAGLKAGLDIIINAVQDATGKLVDLVVGHPVRAHREGVKVSKEIYAVQVGSPADIVIVDSYPADIDLWQAGKAIEAASFVVKKGGVIILVTPCPDGVAPAHPIWLELAGLPEAEVRRMIDDGEDKVGALAALGQARATEGATCIVVSPGITPMEKGKLNLLHADTPQGALGMAFKLCGREAEIIVLRRGGDMLPVGPHD